MSKTTFFVRGQNSYLPHDEEGGEQHEKKPCFWRQPLQHDERHVKTHTYISEPIRISSYEGHQVQAKIINTRTFQHWGLGL